MNNEDNNRRCELIHRDIYDKDLNWFEKQEYLRLQHQAETERGEGIRPMYANLTRGVLKGHWCEEVHGLRESAMFVEDE